MRALLKLVRVPALSSAMAVGVALVAGCGGGGHSTPAAPVPVAGQPAGTGAASTGSAGATFTFHIATGSTTSAALRKPAYIPSTVQSVTFQVWTVNGSVPNPTPTPTSFNVTPGTGPCGTVSAGNYTCTFTVQMPLGSDLTQISTYSAPNAGGSLLSQYSGLLSVVQGASNAFGTAAAPYTLDANPGAITVSPGSNVAGNFPAFRHYGAASLAFTVGIVDASGAAFSGQPGIPVVLATAAPGSGSAATVSGTSLTVVPPSPAPSARVVVEANPASAQDISTTLSASTTAGATSLSVASAIGIYPGANLIVDYAGFSTAGALLQESVRVTAVTGTTLTLSAALANAHSSGAGVVHYADNLTSSTAAFSIALGAPIFTVLPAPVAPVSPTGYSVPRQLTVDSSGNVYVTDLHNNRIVKIPLGTGTPTLLPAPASPLSPVGYLNPNGVGLDSSGNVYVADSSNSRLLEIPLGTGTPTLLPAPAAPIAPAGYNNPAQVAVDSSGNVYVADVYNNRVVEIPNGTGTPVVLPAPAAPISPAGYNTPFGVAVDSAGNVYVTDLYNSRVVKIPNGTGTPVVLPAPAAPISPAGYSYPYGVAVDRSGNVYVADTVNNRIVEVPGGTGTPVVLPAPGAPISPTGYLDPQGIAVDSAANVYISDSSNNRVLKMTP